MTHTLLWRRPKLFLSTLSLRRATESQRPCERPTRDFYPRSPCGERRKHRQQRGADLAISIHALLAESDVVVDSGYIATSQISIHALLAESDFVDDTPLSSAFLFLSTLSLRRATGICKCKNLVVRFLSTLSLRRATA